MSGETMSKSLELSSQQSPGAGYSRDTTVAAIRSFYTFLTRLPRLSPSDILDAPATGWEDISEAMLAPQGKSADVIDLLRHLPYIDHDGKGNNVIAPKTKAIRYSKKSLQWESDTGNLQTLLTPPGAGEIPSHVAVLTTGHRQGSWLLLDTHAGTVTDYIMFELPERKSPTPDSPDYWRAYHTRPVIEFFEEWKDNYNVTEWVVDPDDVDDGVLCSYPGIDEYTDEIREIYETHGWPDSFRRDECQLALHERHSKMLEDMRDW